MAGRRRRAARLLAAWGAFAWAASGCCAARPRRGGGGLLRGFVRFWYDFIVGDDWRIALGVVLVLGAGALLVASDVPDDVLMPLVGAGIVLVAASSIVVGARRRL